MLTLNETELVESDLIIKSVAPLLATTENSICVGLKVGVYTYVIGDNWLACDIYFSFNIQKVVHIFSVLRYKATSISVLRLSHNVFVPIRAPSS